MGTSDLDHQATATLDPAAAPAVNSATIRVSKWSWDHHLFVSKAAANDI